MPLNCSLSLSQARRALLHRHCLEEAVQSSPQPSGAGLWVKSPQSPLHTQIPPQLLCTRARRRAHTRCPTLVAVWICHLGSCRHCVEQRGCLVRAGKALQPCAPRPGRVLLSACQIKSSLHPCKQVHASFPLNHRVPFLISEVASGRSVPWPCVSPPCRSGDTECCDPRQRDEGCSEIPVCCGCRRLTATPALPRSAVSSPKNPV